MADISSAQRISSLNSSSTPLGISGVFTGTAEDVSEFATVSIAAFSNVASATDGLSIQFSTDGTNWDHTDIYTLPANTGKTYTIGRVARYFRIVYTNGGTGQTSFRLQTILNDDYPKPSSHRIQDTINNDDDAELVKSVLTGKSNGTFENVKTASGRLLDISTTNDEYQSELGNVYATTLLKTVATSGTNILLFRNPSGSGKAIKILAISVAVVSNLTDPVSIRFYESPTISADGSALAPVNMHLGSANTEVADVFDGPTHSALGNLFWVETFTKDSGSRSQTEGRIQLDANEQILLRGIAEGTVSVSIRISIMWAEVLA